MWLLTTYTLIMNDHQTDHLDYIHHIESVLAGDEPVKKEDRVLIARLAELSGSPDFDVRSGYERLKVLIEARERERRQRRRRRYLLLGSAAAVVALMVLVFLPDERGLLTSHGDPAMVAQVRETYFLPDSLFGEYDIRLISEEGASYHLRLGDQDTLRVADLAPIFDKGERVSLVVPTTRRSVVRLGDGTVVTLNSLSRLTMPLDGSRQVSLDQGEALMQVVHDESHPFAVSAKDLKLEVLGTTFDVCLYPELAPTATLVDGSLRVTGPGGESVLLKPGEEAVYDSDGLTTRVADLRARTAWVDGIFVFSRLSLSSIMTYLGRWYGFETTYTDDILKHNTYTGALSREYSQDFVFGILEKTTKLKITKQLEGRHVVVSHR